MNRADPRIGLWDGYWGGYPGYGYVVLIPFVALTIYTLVKSRRLADFLDALSTSG